MGTNTYKYDIISGVAGVTINPGNSAEITTDIKGNKTIKINDKLGRLYQVIADGQTTTYEYYDTGSRKKVTYTNTATKAVIASEEYVYNKDNTLSTLTNLTRKASESTRIIDPANPPKAKFSMFIEGEAAANPNVPANIASGTASYEYDVWNQMVKAVTGDGTTVNKYNGDGLRVEKSVNGVTTKYVYESDKVVLEVDSNGKETGRNVYGINLVSRRIDAGQSLSYLYNGHADVTALIDVTGVITASYYYDAFGNPDDATKQNALKNVKNSITYAGYQWDNETGLYYLNARMYDSKIARFMQEDTYRGRETDPLSLNLYVYCINNPIMYSDPTGHTTVQLRDLATAAGATGKNDIVWDGKTNTATVKINGVNVDFKVNGTTIKNVNGHLELDTSVFDKKVESSLSSTTSSRSGITTKAVDVTSKTVNGIVAVDVKTTTTTICNSERKYGDSYSEIKQFTNYGIYYIIVLEFCEELIPNA